MSSDKHRNQHRIGKSTFQVMLTQDENKLILNTMKKLKVKTKKELLILLAERANNNNVQGTSE
ncbi:hypothetical protein AB4428_06420 [Vibrio lentus]